MIDGRGESPEEFTIRLTTDLDPFAPIRDHRVMALRIDQELRGLELYPGEPEYMVYATYAANVAAAHNCELDAPMAVAWGIRDVLKDCANSRAEDGAPLTRAQLPFLPQGIALSYEELVIPPSHRNRNEVVVYRATRYVSTPGCEPFAVDVGVQAETIGDKFNSCHINHPLDGFDYPTDIPFYRATAIYAEGSSDTSGLN